MITTMDQRLTFVSEVSQRVFRWAGLRTFFDTFNQDRTHLGPARQTSNEVYFATGLRIAA